MMSVDASELRTLTADLIQATPAMVGKIQPIVTKAAQNIKKAMQADANKSRHFKQIARTINYDVKLNGAGLNASFDAEIGYDKSAGPAAALAGIAIFGTSRPGGGTVRNPEEALNDEAPEFERWLGDAVGGLL
jgi:hypothetical protein